MDNGKRTGPAEELNLLAEKLDADLDNFMEELAANQQDRSTGPSKSFDFDEWCRDIDQHPAFAKELKPAEDGEYSAEMQALQALKYDEEDPSECAEAYREEGNRHFKQCHYRWAVEAYTKGIKLCCSDRGLNSLLFANRAAAHRRLGNVRFAIRDCMFSCRFDPNNAKAIERCAECLLEIGAAGKCVEWIGQMGEKLEGGERAGRIEELREKANRMKLKEERDERRQKAMESAELAKKRALVKALARRKVKLQPKMEDLDDLNLLEVPFGQLDRHISVHLDPSSPDSDSLIWPLLIQYPERGQTDFVVHCAEHLPLEEVLSEIFNSSPAPWDSDHSFRAPNVRLFVPLDCADGAAHFREIIPSRHSLGLVLSWPGVTVHRGLPVIQIYTKNHLRANRLESVHESDDIFRFAGQL